METFSITLEGGAPWGFSIQGGLDHRSPLRIGKVTSGGRASNAGLLAGDYIVSINGEDCKPLKHLQAQQLIKKSVNSVTLVCTKVRPGITSPALPQTFTFGVKEKKDTPTQQPIVKVQSIPRPKPPQASSDVSSSTVRTLDDSTTAITSSLPSRAEVFDVNFQGLVIADHHPSKSQDNGDGLAPDSCHGDPRNGHHQSRLGKVVDSEVMDRGSATVIQFKRLTKDALASAITQAAANRVRRESSGEREEGPYTDESTEVPVKEQPVVEVHLSEMPSAYDLSSTNSVIEEQPVIQIKHSDEPMIYQFENEPESSSPPSELPPSTDPDPLATEEVGESVCHLEEETEQSAKYRSDESKAVVDESVSYLDHVEQPALMYSFSTLSNNESQDVPSSEPMVNPEPSAVIKREEESVAVVKKDPGWYKQMFQQLHNTVEEDSPEEPYDCRGLRVRTSSLSKTEPSVKADYGLDEDQLGDSGMTKEAILDQSKQSTSYKTERYNTETSRDYWREKDKDHQEWDTKRRLSQEYTTPLHQSDSSQNDYKHTVAHMHPLLRDDIEERSNPHEVTADDYPKLFDRIDASKLNEAISTATVMGQLEHEGVPSHLLPAVIQVQKEAEVSAPTRNIEKPPPGQKAKALFDFCAQGARELSFRKGEFLDLHHTIDENWFEASLGNSRGIIPHKYVQVLSTEEYHELDFLTPSTPTQVAKALFDFEGKSEGELTFKKGDELHIERRVDANWYEGFHRDTRGIFPIAYVQAM